MDISIISTVAENTVDALRPYLPIIATKAAEKIGEEVPNAIKKLWETILDRFSKKTSAKENLEEYIADPDDEELQNIVLTQLKRLLRDDEIFTREIVTALEAYLQDKGASDNGNAFHSVIEGNNNQSYSQNQVSIGSNSHSNTVFMGNQYQILKNGSEQKEPDSNHLRTDYLSHLYANTRFITLNGIDPQVVGDIEARLNLSAIYTALYTRSLELSDSDEIKASTHNFSISDYLSVLDCINRNKHLVLLGDPGCGKSTLVNFVTLCLAGELLCEKDANLEKLIAPIPRYYNYFDVNEVDQEVELKYQSWDHGALIPVRVVLRDFAAEFHSLAELPGKSNLIWAFIEKELTKSSHADFLPYLRRELIEVGGLVLFDGLDEIPSADQMRSKIKRAIEDFTMAYPKCRIIVTSRVYAYQKQDWRLQGYTDVLIAPFSKVQICQLIDRYYAHIADIRNLNHESAQGRASLLKRAIIQNKRLVDLAERPLLLTLMVSLHAWRGGNLPEDREELYEQAVDLLLDLWERNKWERNSLGEITVQRQSIVEYLKVDRKQLRQFLDHIAFSAHSEQKELDNVAGIADGELITGLLGIVKKGDIYPQYLEQYLKERSGLLIEYGNNLYSFPHRTIQEYLAACYLTDHEDPSDIAQLARNDPDRWREVVLLAGAKAARGMNYAVWTLARELCPIELTDSEEVRNIEWGALFAGQCLAESANLQKLSISNKRVLKRVCSWLVKILDDGKFPVSERINAGKFLAKLFDIRFNPEILFLPDDEALGFIEIRTGNFQMGSDQHDEISSSDEHPFHSINLPTYYLSKFPVTVMQYKLFLEDTHRDSSIINGQLSNHPVVNISYFDALDYCEWLQSKLIQNSNPPKFLVKLITEKKWRITIPSEAEWEKGARGFDGNLYPWGHIFDSDKANIDETNLGAISSVGVFPKGASPFGILDMSGNIWEWTRSKFRAYPYESKDGREEPDSTSKRVIRGGSYEDVRRVSRCASRDCISPASRYLYCGFRLALVRP